MLVGVDLAKEKTKNLKVALQGKTLTIAILRFEQDENEQIYFNLCSKMAKELNVSIREIHFPKLIEEVVVNTIKGLNEEEEVDGILINRPLGKLDENIIYSALAQNKDVDGASPLNLGKLFQKDSKRIIPSCPKAIITLLDHYKIQVENKKVIIIGRSKAIGIPLFSLLLEKNAIVTITHSKGQINHLEDYDIVIKTTDKTQFDQTSLKKEVVFIDITNSTSDYILNNYRYTTPSKGGVGPLSIITLFENLYQCFLNK